HYAPFASDVCGFSDAEINFDLGTPFLPFQQLLAVLPAASKKHLPEAYHYLMTAPDSPIFDYYPTSFATDLNGKQNDWEAVVLIPFIDESRLLTAMETRANLLTKEEKRRNRHSNQLSFKTLQDRKTAVKVKSSMPNVFPDILHCLAKCEELDMNLH